MTTAGDSDLCGTAACASRSVLAARQGRPAEARVSVGCPYHPSQVHPSAVNRLTCAYLLLQAAERTAWLGLPSRE